MFTGIIEATGTLAALTPKTGDVRLRVQSADLDMSDVALGDSIATNGICLTVVAFGSDWYEADASNETLSVTTLGHWQLGEVLNLEKAMQAKTRFGGHMVSGHVDGTGVIESMKADARSTQYVLKIPSDLARFVATKGSITLDGVSLTTNLVEGDRCHLNIVPHTAQVTNIAKAWQVGARINLEVDVVARYLDRLRQFDAPATSQSRIDEAFLAQHGFLK